ncbi:MAG: hypothetical protein AAF316_16425 [Cyanobacteria bacterium P01_A01_bin.80]
MKDDRVTEQKICWRQEKDIHDVTLITTILKWLEPIKGNTWKIEENSYEYN